MLESVRLGTLRRNGTEEEIKEGGNELFECQEIAKRAPGFDYLELGTVEDVPTRPTRSAATKKPSSTLKHSQLIAVRAHVGMSHRRRPNRPRSSTSKMASFPSHEDASHLRWRVLLVYSSCARLLLVVDKRIYDCSGCWSLRDPFSVIDLKLHGYRMFDFGNLFEGK
ncbi:hypothetical protein LTR56_020330 [Elasticomyces elasticus]|nr:hypothetical protein LTR56_020330 [Elasticomyces elasticus]KAK3655613.1 hypothetical protein LTR22_010203 [Elasticomyces elasticus]KAK4910271.1 hypothetical protein LTR49_021017 [Elasticomyces elasticus]KAK5748509.1 hypothetical protein LTS12_021411 [Elasticomyces elasticus]